MSSENEKRQTFTTAAIDSGVDEMVLLGDPRLDSLMTTVVALGSELWSTKRRMHVLERLLADKGVDTQMVEEYVPTPEETQEWNAERGRFIDAVYGHLAEMNPQTE